MFFVLHYYCILVAPIMLLNFKNGLEKIMDFTKLSTYNYHLPEELIAQSPEEKRDNSRLLTINKENGCLFKLDLSKVMWSKGNNNERLRIAKLVRDGETVIDMFAGIGYFSIPIGVHAKAHEVISIEINPNSYHFLCENIKLNKLDNITPILGDCMIETPKFKADRIIMGYVKTTHHYLKVAIDSLNEGGILHYHETVPEKLMKTRPIERIIAQADKRDVELLKINKIKKYAPGVEHVVVDVKIN